MAANPDEPEFAGGKKMTDTYKVVFTKTLDKSAWNHTDIATGELAEEINKLKNQDGKDMIVYGGATFVSSLIKARLINEFHLFINPTIIGNGMTIFKQTDRQNLTLIKSKSYDCGIMVLHYEPKNSQQ